MDFLIKQLQNMNEKIKDWSTTKKMVVFIGIVAFIFIFNSVFFSNFGGSRYIELSQSEMDSLDCKELLNKNVGKTKVFCGQMSSDSYSDGTVFIAKQDLFNVHSDSKYCGSAFPIGNSCMVYVYAPGKISEIVKRSSGSEIIFKGRIYPALNSGWPYFKNITFIGFNDPGIRW